MQNIIFSIYLIILVIGMSAFAYVEYKKSRKDTYVNTNNGKLYVIRNIVDLMDRDGGYHRSIIVFDMTDRKEIVIDLKYFKENFKPYYVC